MCKSLAVLFCSFLILAGSNVWGAQSALILCDFETPQDVTQWEFSSGTPRVVSEGVAHGRHALEIRFDPAGRYRPAYMTWRRVRRDWSEFDALELDVTNPGRDPMPAYVLIADQAWIDNGRTYWNRHNAGRTLPPGRTTWIVPVNGLYRGEAGSRNNDLKSNIDPRRIVRLDFGFGKRGGSGRVLLDHLRLVRAGRPPGVLAFDFGPPSQAVMPGWIPVSHLTQYTKNRGWGWGPRGGTPWDGADRDTTFGPMLTRDFCEAGGYDFHLDLPPGTYRVTTIYENSGYWGGEQARQTVRRIRANGAVAWQESRPDGPAHSLYRFENVEPVHRDVWDTYMKAELTRPISLSVSVGTSGLTLRFEADRAWGSKVAALVVHEADDTRAARWVKQQMTALADEFRGAAVCLDRPPADFAPSAAWQALGLTAWKTRIEADVTPDTTPTDPLGLPQELTLDATAVKGEYEPFCLAVRPLDDLGVCRLSLDQDAGPVPIPARVSVVYYNTSRGFGNIAYHVRPHTLRDRTSVFLPAGVTRELIVTVHPAAETPAGVYSWRLTLSGADGRRLLRVPLRLNLRPVVLNRDTDFLMGFYGLMPPPLIPEAQRWAVLEKTLEMIREHGMNAVSGGPNWRLKGWRDGNPLIEYGEMDRFFALLRRYGFTRPLNGYGGARFRGLHDRYEKGRTGRAVEKQSGLAYPEALRRAWQAVKRHSSEKEWPTILYAMCDETRVREVAERQLEFMKMMERVSAAFPDTVRTSGSYSVTFNRRPSDPSDLLYWHQRFFEHLDVSALNNHDASVLREARRRDKEVQIYNQGRSRYSFGLYQWSEYRKGVRARWQWHLNILYGYQFFDLDGREPDTAMLCYGRRELYPTIHFERCREGVEDFYLLDQLEKLTAASEKAGRTSPAVRSARKWLDALNANVGVNRREPPAGYDAYQMKREIIGRIEAVQNAPTRD
ncbi:MAG: hypothetical protein GXP31_15105 [Kiritimatiellaeota bacterium]|nr:hypothetical protein [Kiritimatiellota bacterium]